MESSCRAASLLACALEHDVSGMAMLQLDGCSLLQHQCHPIRHALARDGAHLVFLLTVDLLVLCRAATEAASDHESPEPAKNIVELLAPFLAAQPPDVSSQPAIHANSAANTATQSAAEAPQAEQAEVQKFVEQQHANSGLYAVSSGLLERLLSTGFMPLSSEVTKGVMIIEAAVQGKPYDGK